nr:hypothetical protein Itr_chr07CG02440 [Ipomoea trifida]
MPTRGAITAAQGERGRGGVFNHQAQLVAGRNSSALVGVMRRDPRQMLFCTVINQSETSLKRSNEHKERMSKKQLFDRVAHLEKQQELKFPRDPDSKTVKMEERADLNDRYTVKVKKKSSWKNSAPVSSAALLKASPNAFPCTAPSRDDSSIAVTPYTTSAADNFELFHSCNNISLGSSSYTILEESGAVTLVPSLRVTEGQQRFCTERKSVAEKTRKCRDGVADGFVGSACLSSRTLLKMGDLSKLRSEPALCLAGLAADSDARRLLSTLSCRAGELPYCCKSPSSLLTGRLSVGLTAPYPVGSSD